MSGEDQKRDDETAPNAWLWDREAGCWLPHRLPVNEHGQIGPIPLEGIWSMMSDPDSLGIRGDDLFRGVSGDDQDRQR